MTKTPTVEDLRALLEKATARPWMGRAEHIHSRSGNVCSVSSPRASTIVGYHEVKLGADDAEEAWANAALIVAAVNALPDLIAALRALPLLSALPIGCEGSGSSLRPTEEVVRPPAPMPTGWRPKETLPRDGTPFWAYLYQTGIRQMRWASPEECAEYEGGDVAEYDGCFVEVEDFDTDWSPAFWLPFDALPSPPIAQAEKERG